MNNLAAASDLPNGAEPRKQSLLTHLLELRARLLWSFVAMVAGTIICFFFAQEIYGFLVRPLAAAMSPYDSKRLIYTGLSEAFLTYMKVAFFAGCFLSFPVLLSQIWIFVAPGLHKNERRAFLPFLIATPVLFFAGGALVYYVIMPLAWQFFLSFETLGGSTVLPIRLEARVSEYLDLVMVLIFAFGVCFELPVVLTLLGRVGIVRADMLARGRRYAIVAAFAAGAVLTPPDVLSQFCLALPIIGLYELSIFCVRFIEKNGARAA